LGWVLLLDGLTLDFGCTALPFLPHSFDHFVLWSDVVVPFFLSSAPPIRSLDWLGWWFFRLHLFGSAALTTAHSFPCFTRPVVQTHRVGLTHGNSNSVFLPANMSIAAPLQWVCRWPRMIGSMVAAGTTTAGKRSSWWMQPMGRARCQGAETTSVDGSIPQYISRASKGPRQSCRVEVGLARIGFRAVA
jgi:hypothetical protein